VTDVGLAIRLVANIPEPPNQFHSGYHLLFIAKIQYWHAK